MTDPARDQTDRAGSVGRATQWWWAAGALVIGLFAGGIIVGLLSNGSSTSAAGSSTGGSAPSVSGSPRSTASPSSGATAQVNVNDACLRAVNAAQDAYTALNQVGDAARQLNATRLDEIIRRLQPLQSRLRDDVRACRVVTRLPDGSVLSSPPPVIGASPSPSG